MFSVMLVTPIRSYRSVNEMILERDMLMQQVVRIRYISPMELIRNIHPLSTI